MCILSKQSILAYYIPKAAVVVKIDFVLDLFSNVNKVIDLIFTLRDNKGGDNHRMKGQACRMAHIAYVRVSTAEQNEARQIEALKKHGIDKWFTEKVSGKNMNRPQLEAMLDYVREGDTVYIHDFSRLARSTKDLLAIVEQLQDKNVHLVSNKENLDTSTPTGKLMLTMIAAINEFERENLLERQRGRNCNRQSRRQVQRRTGQAN